MEIIKCLNNAIDYIENNLDSDLEIDKVSKVAYTSKYHFQNLFHAITGFTLAEYIRNRRLTLAGEELAITNSRVIDIALKYGYDSPDAFTKAFQRLHGITPSALRKGEGKLKAFPKLLLQVSIKGGCEMIYRIVQGDFYKVFGVEFEKTIDINDGCHTEVPEFCDRIWQDGTHFRMNQFLGYPKMHMLFGFHYDFKEDGSRRYLMGWEVPEKEVPKEYKILDIPSCTWAVFEIKGDSENRLKIRELWKQIYAEWFPSSGFEQIDGPCIEKYFWDDDEYDKYTCEVWIPVRKK